MQYNRLNRGYCVILPVFSIFSPLHPHKTTFAAVFFIMYVVCTLYIGKTHKSVLFAVYRLFLA
nr:MAG TPA: hypothetical protein [Bacteriophage sp.]